MPPSGTSETILHTSHDIIIFLIHFAGKHQEWCPQMTEFSWFDSYCMLTAGQQNKKWDFWGDLKISIGFQEKFKTLRKMRPTWLNSYSLQKVSTTSQKICLCHVLIDSFHAYFTAATLLGLTLTVECNFTTPYLCRLVLARTSFHAVCIQRWFGPPARSPCRSCTSPSPDIRDHPGPVSHRWVYLD